MNKSLSTAVLAVTAFVLSTSASAAPAAKKTEALTCDRQEVINALAENLVQTNKLSPKLKLAFDQIKTISSVQKKGQVDLKCSTFLKLVNEDGSVADQLTIAYEMKQNEKGEMTMSFEPQR